MIFLIFDTSYTLRMIVFPNGKINLGLSVLNDRDDGFHNIESIVYPVPIFDVLEFYKSKQLTIEVYGMDIPGEPSENILYKAWLILHKKYDIPPVDIKILKGIPFGSGLGGGSADAAFLIKALDNYFGLNLPSERLINFAAQIGSDCPFFIENKPAVIKGRGEIVEQVDLSLKDFHIIIVISDTRISTKQAFRNITSGNYSLNVSDIIKKPIEEWQGLLRNDFEKTTFEKHPSLQRIKERMLKEGAIYTSLSGSGGAVFGIFEQHVKLNTYFPEYFIRHGVLN